jgi:hypothetical protein
MNAPQWHWRSGHAVDKDDEASAPWWDYVITFLGVGCWVFVYTMWASAPFADLLDAIRSLLVSVSK